MTGVCQYCGAPVAHAEVFLRLCVLPCCARCRWVPLTAALTTLALLAPLAFFIVWELLRHGGP